MSADTPKGLTIYEAANQDGLCDPDISHIITGAGPRTRRTRKATHKRSDENVGFCYLGYSGRGCGHHNGRERRG